MKTARRVSVRPWSSIAEFATAHASFGVGGTPSAVVVDRDGVIASEVAAGGDNVMHLLIFS